MSDGVDEHVRRERPQRFEPQPRASHKLTEDCAPSMRLRASPPLPRQSNHFDRSLERDSKLFLGPRDQPRAVHDRVPPIARLTRGHRRRVHAAHDVPSRTREVVVPVLVPTSASIPIPIPIPIALPSLSRASLRRRDRREQHALTPTTVRARRMIKPQHRPRARLAHRRRRRRSQHRASIPSSSLGARLQRVRQVHEDKREERPRERHRAVVPTRELVSVVERHDIESSGVASASNDETRRVRNASTRHSCAR